MGNNLLLTSISDIALEMGDAPFGSNLKNSDYTDDGVLVVQGRNVTGRVFTWSNNRYVSLVKYNSIPRSHCFVGDLIFPKVGTIGKVGRLSACEGYDKYILSTNTMRLRVDPKKANPLFVYYYFTWKKTVNLIQAMNSKSVQPVFNFTTLKKFPIGLPPRRSQDFSAKTLDSIDNKIELNQKTNQTLEQMAQALFKSWFVDFDPVFDNLLANADFKLENFENSLPDELKQKAQRRLAALNSLENATQCKASLSALAHELQAQLPTKEATQAAVQVSEKAAETPVKANFNANPNILAQHASTHAHFPNEFEHNEQLGWIPKGWESKTIDELCKINPESWTKKNAPEVVKYVDLANAKNGSVGEAIEYSFSEAPSRARRVLRPHDTIIGVVRPANRSFAYVNEDNLTGSTGFAVVRANNQNCRAFAYFSLTNDDCIQEFTRIADGAAYPAIKPEDVAKTYCVYSNNKILDAFESSIGKFMTKVAKNEQQNRYLTKLRDTLLPKLISGELQIPDVTTDEETVN